MLINGAILGDRNVIKKGAAKNLKYKDLTTEIQHMWNVKAKVIPVIIGATGTISKSLTQYLSNKPDKHEIKELQNNSQTVHCTQTAESADVKYKTYFMGEITLHVARTVNNITCSTDCK